MATKENTNGSGLPYITAPGNVEKALKGIISASTPAKVSQDFVKTILKVKGGSGNQVTAFLRKIGFAKADGTPSDLYGKFRNVTSRGSAAVEALRTGYKDLYTRNEYMHELSDTELRGLILEETGASADSATPTMILSCIKALKSFADFSAVKEVPKPVESVEDKSMQPYQPMVPPQISSRVGMNLSYTINLNLPETTDVAVFNAIFKSLKDNLLQGDE